MGPGSLWASRELPQLAIGGWGALGSPTSQTWPCLGPTQGSVCLSCRPFSLNDLDDYEKHFTVMNYDPEVVLKQVGARQTCRPGPPPSSLSSGQAV